MMTDDSGSPDSDANVDSRGGCDFLAEDKKDEYDFRGVKEAQKGARVGFILVLLSSEYRRYFVASCSSPIFIPFFTSSMEYIGGSSHR